MDGRTDADQHTDIVPVLMHSKLVSQENINKKHLKNVGPILHCEPPHAHSPDVATDTACASMSTTTPTTMTTTTTRDRKDRYGPMEWAQ